MFGTLVSSHKILEFVFWVQFKMLTHMVIPIFQTTHLTWIFRNSEDPNTSCTKLERHITTYIGTF
jgi:3-methyladenine DNA glycosylase AlkD